MRWWVLVLVGWSVLGCGSDHPGQYMGVNEAPGKCDTVLEEYCARAADCIIQLGIDPGATRDQENQSCLSAFKKEVDCAKAVTVSSYYEQCISELPVIECSSFEPDANGEVSPLPPSCLQVIKVQN